MLLYVCSLRKAGAPLHPCARAGRALDRAGHRYELRQVRGGSLKPWTWAERPRDRDVIRRLSGQHAVPILVTDSGQVITGSARIVAWARSHPPRDCQALGAQAPHGT